jgi:hypothetical protein
MDCVLGKLDRGLFQRKGTPTDDPELYVPSKLLLFPDEGHWILKPPNSLL